MLEAMMGGVESMNHPYMAIGVSGAPYLRIIDLEGSSFVEFSNGNVSPQDLDFSPNGLNLAVVGSASSGQPGLNIYENTGGNNWSLVPGTPTLPATGFACKWSNNGQRLAIAHGTSGLTILDTSDYSVLPGVPNFASTGISCAWNSNDSRLVVASTDAKGIRVLNMDTLSFITTPSIGTSNARSCIYTPDDNNIYIGLANSPYLRVLETAGMTTVSGTPSLGSSAQQNSIAASSIEPLIAIGVSEGDQKVKFIDTAGITLKDNYKTALVSVNRGLTFSDSGVSFATASQSAPQTELYSSKPRYGFEQEYDPFVAGSTHLSIALSY